MNLKSTRPLVSVIVTVYNKSSYIGECLTSILNNSYSNFELIIVNDGSTDNSIEIVSQFMDSRIKIINKKNGGAASARNAGLDIAKGEYITFIDADDAISVDYLQIYVSYSLKYDADICYTNFQRFSGTIPKENKKIPKIVIFQKSSYFDTDINKVISSGKMFSKRLISGLRFKFGRIHEDEEFYTLLLQQNIKNIVYIDKSFYFYRVVPNSVTDNKTKECIVDGVVVLLDRLEFLKKIDCKNIVAIKYCFNCLQFNLFNRKYTYPFLKRFSFIRRYGLFRIFFFKRKIISLFYTMFPLISFCLINIKDIILGCAIKIFKRN